MTGLPPEFEQALGSLGKGSLQTVGLLLGRIIPIVAFTPLFGGEAVPRRMRLGLAILLAIGLLPGFLPLFDRPAPWLGFSLLALKEALIGLALALFLNVFFEIFSAFGALVDLSRGATMANILDPLTKSQESPLALFFLQMAIVLFFAIGGHRLLLEAIADSFVVLPPQQTLPPHLWGTAAAFNFISLVADLFLIAFRLAAPVLLVVLLLDVALGLINRVAPQIQVNFVGMEIKGSVGVFIVLASLALIVNNEFPAILRAMRQWLVTFNAGS